MLLSSFTKISRYIPLLCLQFSAVENKLRGRSKEDETAKFADIDNTLKRLDRKIKEGSVLDPSGPRGANKVRLFQKAIFFTSF